MIDEILERSRRAADSAPPIGDAAYPGFADAVERRLLARWADVVEANTADLDAALAAGLTPALAGRMRVTGAHRDAVTELTRRVRADLPEVTRPGPAVHGIGTSSARLVPRPLGVLLMIYEARPMVTVDSAVLGVCAGNTVLLRGGTECRRCNGVLAEVLDAAARDAGLPDGMVQVLLDTDRAGLRELLRRDDAIDVLVPRGGASLTGYCRTASRIPVIAGGAGVNHLYVHATADPRLAVRLVLDSKLPDPAGCTALEMLLLDEEAAGPFLDALADRVAEPDVGALALRVSADLAGRVPARVTAAIDVAPLGERDDGREFLDPTLAVRTVPGLDAAVRHIRRHGTGHTDGIVTASAPAAAEFGRRVDSAAVVINGSLRLHDGPSLGLGPEIAISTGRLHVRGPVGLDALLTRSWLVEGGGTVRFRTEETREKENVR